MIDRPSKFCLLAPLLALAACGGGSDRAADKTAPSPTPPPVAQKPAAPPPKPLSCRDEIGPAAAARRVRICRNVSPATHPPCNVANSCKMIDDEIARSCALFADDGPPMPGCPVS